MQTDEDVGKVAAAVPVLICILLNDTKKIIVLCMYLHLCIKNLQIDWYFHFESDWRIRQIKVINLLILAGVD